MKRAARRTISGYFLWVLLLPVAIGAQSVKEMRVMTYNIRYKNAIDSINNWENRKANVAALIKYHQAGIIGMQEAFLSQIADLEKVGDVGRHAPDHHLPRAEHHAGEIRRKTLDPAPRGTHVRMP